MASRFFTIGALVAITAFAAASDVSTFRHTHLRPSKAPGNSPLRVFGVRSAQQRGSSTAAKFDGALADLTRHAPLARPDHAVEDLQSLAPGVKFTQNAAGAAPLVLIDAVTLGDPQQLKAALVALGLQRPSVYSNDVGGWLPVSQLDAATARAEVHSIRAAMPRTRTGAVTSQGDYVQHSAALRSANSLTGAGVTVGVLSNSYDCYAVYAANNVAASGPTGYAGNGFLATAATDISTGDLPSNVTVLEEAKAGNGGCLNYGAPMQLPFSDEGRAMLQIVYDVAPGASLAFYTGENSEADFANGIGQLAAPVSAGGAGAKVIADDLGYFDEPFFQDGILAQAIDAVEANGVAYFSAAGNNGTLAYDNVAPSFATSPPSSAPNAGELLLNFDASGVTTTASLPVTIASLVPGEFVAIVVEWDQPYVTGAPNSGGATSQIDVCLIGAGPDQITDNDGNVATCSGPNAVRADSYQVMIVGNPANASGNTAAENLSIQVGLAGGTAPPGRIKVAVEDDGAGSTINAFQTNTPTIQGHPGAAGAAAVGAAFFFNTPACGSTPAQLENFSSEGGAPILFDTAGTRLTAPVVRQKPDFAGPDGVNNTFLGFTLASDGYPGGMLNTANASCQNNPSYPNFFGTSAATPHAAGIAALMLEANPAATPMQIYQALRSSALAMNSPSPSFESGYGFIQADAALVVPTMTVAATAVAVGGTTTLTWTSIDASSCTASGTADWSGARPASGSQTVTMSNVGTNTYTLSCANASGTISASSSVSLTDVAPAAPMLVLSKSAIDLGQSSTITWSSANAAGCTASGNWSGSLPASGSQTVVPTAGGTATYSLTCANVIGSSAAGSASLAVAVPPPPAAPSLKLAAKSITVGNSTTITWSSVDATGCTASGSWSGSLGTSGSQTVQPTAAGADTYTLTCVNDGGASQPTSVKLTVTALAGTASGHSGGGGFDVLALLGLAGLGAARFYRLRPRVIT
jgi:subtilase family protein